MIVDFIRRSWPALLESDVRKITDRDCENWLTRFQQQYAPSAINDSIGTLRAIFEEAISTDARFNNPAGRLSRVRIRPKRLDLPSREVFLRFVEEIRIRGTDVVSHRLSSGRAGQGGVRKSAHSGQDCVGAQT